MTKEEEQLLGIISTTQSNCYKLQGENKELHERLELTAKELRLLRDKVIYLTKNLDALAFHVSGTEVTFSPGEFKDSLLSQSEYVDATTKP